MTVTQLVGISCYGPKCQLQMVSMAMVPMHLNTGYIKMVSMAVAMEMDL